MQPSGVDIIDRVLGGIAPGVPCVLAGPSGSGRSVLALQLAAAAMEAGRVATLLCNEPPSFLLQQSRTLGLALEDPIRRGQLVVLECDAAVATTFRAHGAEPLVEALRSEEPLSSALIVDPFTALTAEILDEPALRAQARAFVRAAGPLSLVLTLETERLRLQPALERVLEEICGAFVSLHRERGGRRVLQVEKTRGGFGDCERAEFAIGPGGAVLVRALDAERSDAAEPASPATTRADASATSPGPDDPAPCAPAGASESGKRTILVVDADPATRELTSKWLGDRYEIVTAADGLEAMTTLLNHRPDLVVLDLVMPKITGYELLGAFRRAAPEIRLLVVSGRVTRPSDRLGPLVLGATDVLAKPFERFEFVHKVETLLRLQGPGPALVDPAEAQALFGNVSKTRALSLEDFRARLRRACDFGERFGLRSSLVAASAPSSQALDRLAEVTDAELRFEDATLRVSRRRLLILLVATEPADAGNALERLRKRLGEAGGEPDRFAFRVAGALPIGEGAEIQGFFRTLAKDVEEEPA